MEKKALIAIGGVSLVLLAVAVFVPDLSLHMRTQVVPGIESEPSSVAYDFFWEPDGSTEEGVRQLTVRALDEAGNMSTETITVTVEGEDIEDPEPPVDLDPPIDPDPPVDPDPPITPAPTPPQGGGDAPEAFRTYGYLAERDHIVSGNYSGVVREGPRTVVKLADNRAFLSKHVHVPRGNYWLEVNAKHDRPGPVDMVVYVNNRAWQVVRLDRSDNVYRTHRIGLLRNFESATIGFRLLNDTFDPNDPMNPDTDRNLYIDWWRLTTNDVISPVPVGRAISAPPSIPPAPGRSNGWTVLYRLNSIIREELGPEYITVDFWRYYAWRLTVPTHSRASIQSEAHLRVVMRYWKLAQPDHPKGEMF